MRVGGSAVHDGLQVVGAVLFSGGYGVSTATCSSASQKRRTAFPGAHGAFSSGQFAARRLPRRAASGQGVASARLGPVSPRSARQDKARSREMSLARGSFLRPPRTPIDWTRIGAFPSSCRLELAMPDLPGPRSLAEIVDAVAQHRVIGACAALAPIPQPTPSTRSSRACPAQAGSCGCGRRNPATAPRWPMPCMRRWICRNHVRADWPMPRARSPTAFDKAPDGGSRTADELRTGFLSPRPSGRGRAGGCGPGMPRRTSCAVRVPGRGRAGVRRGGRPARPRLALSWGW